jgi:hypothetical protein
MKMLTGVLQVFGPIHYPARLLPRYSLLSLRMWVRVDAVDVVTTDYPSIFITAECSCPLKGFYQRPFNYANI